MNQRRINREAWRRAAANLKPPQKPLGGPMPTDNYIRFGYAEQCIASSLGAMLLAAGASLKHGIQHGSYEFIVQSKQISDLVAEAGQEAVVFFARADENQLAHAVRITRQEQEAMTNDEGIKLLTDLLAYFKEALGTKPGLVSPQ